MGQAFTSSRQRLLEGGGCLGGRAGSTVTDEAEQDRKPSWEINVGEKRSFGDAFSEVHPFAETESARRNL